jgi:hypothetical protein
MSMMMHTATGSRRRTSVEPPVEPETPLDVTAWYVATNGSDGAAGTQGAPFLTVSKAVEMASADPSRKTIYVRGGTHRFTTHIDMAASSADLTIAGYPGETAVISGGERLTGFASEGSGLYSVSTTITSLDLAIGNKRQRVAQTGVLDPADPYHTGFLLADAVATPSTTQFRFRDTDVPAGLVQAGLMAQLPGMSPIDTNVINVTTLKPVSAIDYTSKTITLTAADTGAETVKTGSVYRLLNHASLIRNTREFGWRASDGKLVVKPESYNFQSLGVMVPRVQSLFQMDAGADNVTFSNLTFADVRWDGAAVYLSGAVGVRFGGCRFLNLGTGIHISSGNNTLIAGNTFEGTAGDALYIGTNVSGTTIYANTFRDVGEFGSGSALYCQDTSNTKVVYNDVYGAGQYAFSFKGAGTGHTAFTCSNNFITRTNRRAYDTGAIEFLNPDDVDLNATVSGNYISDAGGFGINASGTLLDPYRASCIYLDDLSSDVTVTKNFLRGATWGQVFIHGGDDNVIENNFHIIQPQDLYVSTLHDNGDLTGNVNPERNSFQKNIYYSTTARTGTLWNVDGLGADNVINNNIYFNLPLLSGYDADSQIADPLFADFGADSFVLQGTSPAFAKGIVDLEWSRMGTYGYTESAATTETLPRFWSSWADAPFLDLNYQTHVALYGVETFSRPSGATYFNNRGRLVEANGNQPRFNFNPATQEPLGLLLEDATTNLLANSSDLTSAAWVKNNTTASSGGGIGLDGANTLSVLTKTSEQGTVTQELETFPVNSFLTASVYLKKGTLDDWVYLNMGDRYAWFNLATGTTGTMIAGGTNIVSVATSMTSMGGGIYKCVFTVATTGITDSYLRIAGDVSDQGFWGTVGATVLLAGAQVEAKDHATSLVLTTTEPVTRAADTLYITSTEVPDLAFADAEGTVIADIALIQPVDSSAATIVSIDDGDASAATSDRVEISRTASGAFQTSIVTAGASQMSISGSSIPQNTDVRLTAAWKVNDAMASVNGAIIGTDTSVTVPTGLNRINLAARSAADSAVASGHYRRVRVYGKRITAFPT